MTLAGRVTPGEERTCPHCRAKILKSATRCPVCGHSLRYDSHGVQRDRPVVTALSVEGTIRPPDAGEKWEYSVVVSIKNAQGKEIARQMVGVGALGRDEARTFSVDVAMSKLEEGAAGKGR